MNLIFDNQISIFENTFYKYLTPKQCTKFYTSNLILYNIYLTNNEFKRNYFTPKKNERLQEAVNEWCGLLCNSKLCNCDINISNRKQMLLKYGHISFWNTKYITDMNNLFNRKYNFNDNISDWNISNVIDMRCMFVYTRNFNQPLNNWNVSNVIKMPFMFYDSNNFNQDLNKWNIENVIDMRYIFSSDTQYKNKFNRINISNWKFNNKVIDEEQKVYNNDDNKDNFNYNIKCYYIYINIRKILIHFWTKWIIFGLFISCIGFISTFIIIKLY